MAEASCIFEKILPRGKYCIYQSHPSFDVTKVKQTHSNIVLEEENTLDREADGIVGKGKNALAILTADCLPVVLIGSNGHALIHAGWRGLQNQILKNEKIRSINPFYAFIGPHISSRHYEVQSDFKLQFPENENAFLSHGDKLYFDMNTVVNEQLEKFYPGIKIEISQLCTFEEEQFFSYRRNHTKDRNWNIYIP